MGVVYMDDLLMLAEDGMTEEVIREVQQEWEASSPQWFGEEPVRFCGVEVRKKEDGFVMTHAKDIVERNGVKGRATMPMSKDLNEPEVEENLTPVRFIQRRRRWVS